LIRSQLQLAPIARQLKVASPDFPPVATRAHGTFPVDRPRARARIQLLIVHERFEIERELSSRYAHRYGILGAAARRPPVAQWREAHVARPEDARHSFGIAPCPARPDIFAALPADAKRHERPAVGQVDTDPVPARGIRCQILAGPFVIEPGVSLHVHLLRLDRNAAARSKMWLAVVVAGLLRAGSLAAEAALAFREQRLRRLELQIETEIARSDPRNVAILCELQRPVLDPDMRVAFVGAGETQPRARRTLVVTQAATSRVGECRMREDDLLRRERARILFLDAGASAKERDLNAEIVAVRILDPARDVPPFRAEGRVAAVIARERELQTGFDIWILGRCRSGDAKA